MQINAVSQLTNSLNNLSIQPLDKAPGSSPKAAALNETLPAILFHGIDKAPALTSNDSTQLDQRSVTQEPFLIGPNRSQPQRSLRLLEHSPFPCFQHIDLEIQVLYTTSLEEHTPKYKKKKLRSLTALTQHPDFQTLEQDTQALCLCSIAQLKSKHLDRHKGNSFLNKHPATLTSFNLKLNKQLLPSPSSKRCAHRPRQALLSAYLT